MAAPYSGTRSFSLVITRVSGRRLAARSRRRFRPLTSFPLASGPLPLLPARSRAVISASTKHLSLIRSPTCLTQTSSFPLHSSLLRRWLSSNCYNPSLPITPRIVSLLSPVHPQSADSPGTTAPADQARSIATSTTFVAITRPALECMPLGASAASPTPLPEPQPLAPSAALGSVWGDMAEPRRVQTIPLPWAQTSFSPPSWCLTSASATTATTSTLPSTTAPRL